MKKLQRLIHLIFGHPYSGSKHIDKLTSEKHHATSRNYIYTINIRECKCGLFFFDVGLETRKFTKKYEPRKTNEFG